MERGFTLVEIAIVVLVLGLLLASLLGPLSIRIEQQETRKTSDQMEEIKEALYGYAMANGALPCPDANADGNGDGLADPLVATAASACDAVEGWLPFQTLSVVPGDAWGFRFRYRVTPEFTVRNIATCDDDNDGDLTNPDGNLDLCDKGDIKVRTKGYTTPHPPTDLADDAPAVILSHGKNGLGATRYDSTCIPPPVPAGPPGPNCMPSAPDNTDEQENTNRLRSAFISRHYSTFDTACNDADNTAPFCEYDDIVIWLSANVLKYRLVQAGRLP